MVERIEDIEKIPGVTNLSGYPAVGTVAPEGTYWRGWIDLRGKTERVLIYCAATRGGAVHWLDGLVAGGSGDWLPERNAELAEAVRATARESLG